MAGHWPLDWYYRCNIVNNVPLSWRARGERSRLCPHQVTARTHRAARQPPNGPAAPFVRTLLPSARGYRCLLLNIHSLRRAIVFARGEHGVSTPPLSDLLTPGFSGLTIRLPRPLASFCTVTLPHVHTRPTRFTPYVAKNEFAFSCNGFSKVTRR